MMYKIVVAKYYKRNWNNTEDLYNFYFRIEENDDQRAKEVAKSILNSFKPPEYKVSYGTLSGSYQATDFEFEPYGELS